MCLGGCAHRGLAACVAGVSEAGATKRGPTPRRWQLPHCQEVQLEVEEGGGKSSEVAERRQRLIKKELKKQTPLCEEG